MSGADLAQATPEPKEKVAVSAPTESVFGMAARMEDFSFSEPEVIIPTEQKEEPAKPERELTEFEILEQNTKFNKIDFNC